MGSLRLGGLRGLGGHLGYARRSAWLLEGVGDVRGGRGRKWGRRVGRGCRVRLGGLWDLGLGVWWGWVAGV